MVINVKNLSAKLQEAIGYLRSDIDFELGEGISVKAIESSVNTIEQVKNELRIYYKSYNYIFRGLKMFLQEGDCRIIDDCAFDSLGIMIDCSRNAVMNVNSVKKLMRLMAMMGYNTLQLYTEDTYEVKNEPYFGYMRGKYTQSELKELDAYGRLFGIELVPCVQTLAHLNAIFYWGNYYSIKDIDDILLVDDERTYALLDNIFSTLAECFTSRKVNIGMDEAINLGRGKYLTKNGYVPSGILMHKHLSRVLEIAEKYGFKCSMWSDMFFRGEGDNYGNIKKLTPEMKANIPENVTLTYWDYYSTDRKNYEQKFKLHMQTDNEIAFAGGAWSWVGFTPHNAYTMRASEAAMKSCISNGIKSYLVTMWGDNGGECSPFALLPSLCYIAENSYGHQSKTHLKKCVYALTGIKYETYMALDAPSQVLKGETEENCIDKCLLYADCFRSVFERNVSEDDNSYSEVAKRLRRGEKSERFGYLFRSARTMSEALSVKFSICKKTRELYLAGDKEGLKNLVKECYVPLIAKLTRFYDEFETRWMNDNKPHGFDVQDYRIGGLIARVKHCKKMILDYCNGKIESIPELSEKVLELRGGGDKQEKLNGYFNSFALSASSNIF